jgi:iron complex transport system permease protein
MKKDGTGKLNAGWVIVLILLPVLFAAAALCIGRFSIPPREVFAALTGSTGAKMSAVEITVRNIRLPRVILALLVGAGLSAAGCSFQSLFANPLATPDTLGVASGAGFGAVLGLLLNQNLIGMQALSLGFGILAVALTWLAGSGKGRGMSSVVLGGIMIGSLFNALISFVKFAADEESKLPSITYWLMGGLDKANFKSLSMGAPPIILGILVLYLLRWRMNLLPLSEDEIRSSGVNIRMLRGTVVLCATFMTASCVSMCGQVGWVGLLIPHMCRMKFGTNHLSLFPASVSFGAVFMVIVDTVARSMTAAEIPVSILTAIVGAPFFIVLMRRSGGWTF